MGNKPLMSARDLSVHYPLRGSLFGPKPVVRAVEGVNIDIEKGSFFGLVGESGSGKTTLGRALLRAAPITRGTINYDDGEMQYDLPSLNDSQLKDYRKRAQLIFQDPYAALSPRMTVRDIIAEPLEVMGLTKSRDETDARVREIAEKCRLNLEHLRRFPHAFSGGQRQRLSIDGSRRLEVVGHPHGQGVGSGSQRFELCQSLPHRTETLVLSRGVCIGCRNCHQAAQLQAWQFKYCARQRRYFIDTRARFAGLTGDVDLQADLQWWKMHWPLDRKSVV